MSFGRHLLLEVEVVCLNSACKTNVPRSEMLLFQSQEMVIPIGCHQIVQLNNIVPQKEQYYFSFFNFSSVYIPTEFDFQ